MLPVLDRYLLREVVQTCFAVTGILLLILISNRFARVLGEAAAGDLPREAVFTLLGLTSIYYLLILVPVGLFLGIMLALGRLYKDSEMAAVTACGVGPGRLYRPLLLFAGLLAAVLAWLSLDIAPWAARLAYVTKQQAEQDAQIGILEAGRFKSGSGGTAVFYAERIGPEGTLENVFIQRRTGERVEVALAARGEQRRDPATGQRTLVLYDGQRVEGTPGTVDFRIMEFAEHGIPIRLTGLELETDQRETFATRELLGSGDPRDVAELQWRLSIPLSALLLTLLAVPLARTDPRRGRYGRLAAAVLVYMVYANLLGAARIWVERAEVPAFPGLWWVHGLLVMGAMLLLARQNGFFPAFGRRTAKV